MVYSVWVVYDNRNHNIFGIFNTESLAIKFKCDYFQNIENISIKRIIPQIGSSGKPLWTLEELFPIAGPSLLYFVEQRKEF